jgi:hypothetical protein
MWQPVEKASLLRLKKKMRLTDGERVRCNRGGGVMIMMGLKAREFAPLAAVSLEELVPQDHFYRHLQKTLDLSFVYDLVREFYALAGRPSIDPVVFFKLQLVMFFEEDGRQNREAPHSYYQRIADYRVSTTDSDATLMHTNRQRLHLGYHTHYAHCITKDLTHE